MIRLKDKVEVTQGCYKGLVGNVYNIKINYGYSPRFYICINTQFNTFASFFDFEIKLLEEYKEQEDLQADFSELKERHITMIDDYSEEITTLKIEKENLIGSIQSMQQKHSDPKFLLKKLNEILNEKSNKKD